jgi:hypothetical protein
MRNSDSAPRSLPVRVAGAALLLFVLSSLSGSRGEAEEFEQHHAHEHGKVTLGVAIAGPALVIALDAPAANVVGFEHAPRDATERTATESAAKLIRTGNGLIGVPPEAKCHFENTEFTEPKWESDPEPGAAHEHEHGEEHEHHADYEARFTYRCQNPQQLAWFEPWLLSHLLNVTEARVNLITPSGQRSEVVKTARTRISLR